MEETKPEISLYQLQAAISEGQTLHVRLNGDELTVKVTQLRPLTYHAISQTVEVKGSWEEIMDETKLADILSHAAYEDWWLF